MSDLRDSWNDVKASLKGILTLMKQSDPEGYKDAVKEVRTLGMDLLRDIEGLNDYDVKVYAAGIFDDRHVVFKSVPGRNPDDIMWDIIPMYHEIKPTPFFKWMWKHNARFTEKGELIFTPYPDEIEKVKKKMARLAKEPSYTALADDKETPDVIIVTDKIKRAYPELANISMIQAEPVSWKTWPEAMEIAKNLRLGGFSDWRLPTCSGDEDDRTVNNELCGIWLARKVLGIPEDPHWYWSGTEAGASYAWCVSFSNGYVCSSHKSYTHYVRCVR